ncbi:MAG: leucine-rich repeat domain-containing protein [Holosporaceae bacterium]|jgi:hypothetical protein|nr:leucine-rich repeat domain-containing protein [Holosporaceae bacterium]
MIKNVIMMAAAISLCWPASSMRLWPRPGTAAERRAPVGVGAPEVLHGEGLEPNGGTGLDAVRRMFVLEGRRISIAEPLQPTKSTVRKIWLPSNMERKLNLGRLTATRNPAPADVALEFGWRGEWFGHLTTSGRHAPRSLFVPNCVCVIKDHCLYAARGLEHVLFGQPARVGALGRGCFSRTGLQTVDVPDSVVQLKDHCFGQCTNLTNCFFGRGSMLEHIGCGAFADTALEKMSIPATVRRIDDSAFENCRNLTKVTFERDSELKHLGMHAFISCNISEVRLPGKLESIGVGCFWDCRSLRDVTFDPEDMPAGNQTRLTIEREAFDVTQLTHLTLPKNAVVPVRWRLPG